MKKLGIIFTAALCLIFVSSISYAKGGKKYFKIVTVYLPVEQNCITAESDCPNATGTKVTISNTDSKNSITINSAQFGSPDGVLLIDMVEDPITLAPFASTTIVVDISTTGEDFFGRGEGGVVRTGRPFLLIEWEGRLSAIRPIITGTIVSVDINGNLFDITGILETEGRVISRERYKRK